MSEKLQKKSKAHEDERPSGPSVSSRRKVPKARTEASARKSAEKPAEKAPESRSLLVPAIALGAAVAVGFAWGRSGSEEGNGSAPSAASSTAPVASGSASLTSGPSTSPEQACEAGNGDACAQLSELYRKGEAVPEDWARARTFAEKGCAAGSGKGCTALGFAILGPAGEGDMVQAVAQFLRACSLGDETGCVGQGRFMLQGHNMPKDVPGGLQVLEKACEQSTSGYACRILGEFLKRGLGADLPADPAKAATFLGKACSKGDQPACSSLNEQ